MVPKKVEQKLAELTREFFARHPGVKLVAVTGSAGKTSTKIAIATVLSQQYNLQLREEAPQTKADVFLQIMGVTVPEAGGRSKWKKVIEAVERRVMVDQPEVQVIVQEFSPQAPGDNEWFKNYLIPDITVVTAVTEGRMQVEHSVETVAGEMISLANNSKTAMINRDDIEGRFASYLINPYITTYGVDQMAEYYFNEHSFELGKGYLGKIISPENPEGLEVAVDLLGENNLRPAIVAAAVGYKMGVSEQLIAAGINKLQSVPGRMNVLKGGNGSWLIDDSYSSSPSTALSALQTLYGFDAPQRIVVFGNMNGLRGVHEQAHQQLGGYCNIEMLDWVVTVGGRANLFLAPIARRNGCQVKECVDAIEAGAFVREKVQPGGIVLFKGSSGGVWLEEAVKLNLLSASDSAQLVRQDPAWLEKKQAFFTANRSGDGETINKLGITEMEDQVDDQYQQTNQQQPYQQPSAPPPAKKEVFSGDKKNKKALVSGIVIGVILLIIATVAVLYFAWWQNPQKMITDAIVNASKVEQMVMDSKMEIKIPENNITVDLKYNVNAGKSSTDATMKIKSDSLSEDIEVKLDAVTEENGTVYFKLGKIDKVVDLFIKDQTEDYQSMIEEMGQSPEDLPEDYLAEQEAMMRAMLEPMVEKVNDKWIKVSKNSFNDEESQSLSCTAEVFEKLQTDTNLQNEVANAYRDNQFLVVKNKIESRNGGTGFEIDLNSPEAKNRATGFSQAMESTEFGKQIKKCNETVEEDSEAESENDGDLSKLTLKIWVHPMTHQFTSLEIGYNDKEAESEMKFVGDFQMNSSNQVTIPSDSQDIKKLMEEFTGLMFGEASADSQLEDETLMIDAATQV